MGVYINGMEMPKEGFVEILIRDDGTVQQTGQSYRIDGTDYYTPYVGKMPVIHKAVPVSDHGDLIDRDEIDYYEVERNGEKHYMVWKPHIDGLPVIVPSDKGAGE